MADDETGPDLNDILPLLISRQKQQQAEAASRALPGVAAGIVGRTLAPNLYDLLTTPPPQIQAPAPGTVGKVPSAGPFDPRMVPALRDIGMLGAGSLAGRTAARMAAPAAERVLGAAGRATPNLSDPTGALRAITGGMTLTPGSQAQAAPRLTPEQRQALEAERQKGLLQQQQAEQQARIARDAETNRIKAQAEANANAAKLAAETQHQLEEQRRIDAENAAKRQREQPFRERYPTAAEWMPAIGAGTAALVPFAKGLYSKAPLSKFTSEWGKAGAAAEEALKGRSKGASTVAVNKLRDFENQWPSMEKRYTPGLGQTALTSVIPAEMTAFPTEYDYMTQPPGSPSKPTAEDWAATAGRAGVAGLAGTGAAKFGAGLVPKTRPYVGGQGLIKAYETKYPTRGGKTAKSQQKAIADALKGQ